MCRWNPLNILSFLLYIIFVSTSSNNKVDLVIENVLGNLLIPFVSNPFSKILTWNMKVNNYIDSTFFFVDMFFVKDGIVLLFYSNDLWVFKEVQ